MSAVAKEGFEATHSVDSSFFFSTASFVPEGTTTRNSITSSAAISGALRIKLASSSFSVFMAVDSIRWPNVESSYA
jgi:hypothetical protein